jgi:CPA2 family monovalent cation:H+ antiporter-2
MEQFSILTDLLIVFIVSAAVVFVFHHFRLPALVGLLLAGIVVGPYGLKLVHETERVEILAEIGVVILLFTIGLEFSLARLWLMWPLMVKIGLPQVLLSLMFAALASYGYLEEWGKAVFVGMLIAMSSTAVVLKLLSDRGELASPQGRIAVAVLLFQDLLVLVFMFALPFLQGQTEQPVEGVGFWLQVSLGLGVIVLILLAARFLVPTVLYRIMQTRNRELFLATVSVLCLGTAWLTAWSGLSLALGAFLAGLAISDSEYAHQAMAEMLPFRDTLSSLFFVSVGMLLNLWFVVSHLPLVLATVLAIMALKFTVVAGPTWLCGYSFRTAVHAGLALFQVGEFSFVLASRGMEEYGLLANDDYQTFLAAAVITMTLTPLVIQAGSALSERIPEVRWRALPTHLDEVPISESHDLAKHVIIAGYGINGRNVARVLREVDIPYVIIEMNPATVRQLRRQGELIHFGDCSRESVLEHLGIAKASVFVIAISDPQTSRRAVKIARQINPDVSIIVRTRYVGEVEELRKLGADEIIPEEFETSLEIFARVLEIYRLPRNVILDLVDRVRRDHYEVLRGGHSPARLELPTAVLQDVEIETCLIRDDSPGVGKSLRDLQLRDKTGATVIAIQRGEKRLTNPSPDSQLQANDRVFLLGDGPQIVRALAFLDPTIERSLPVQEN